MPVRVVGAVAAAAFLLVGPVAGAAGGPFRLSLDGVAQGRFAYRLADGSLHQIGSVVQTTRKGAATEYRVATDEPSRQAVVDVTPSSGGTTVAFALKPSTNVVETTAAFAGHPGEHFLGGGEREQSLDLAGQSLPVKASSACVTPMPATFYLSSRGYGVAMRGTAVASMAFPGSNLSDLCHESGTPCKLTPNLRDIQVCVKQPGFTYDLFTGTPEQVVSKYVRSVGLPSVPPQSTLELIKWRDSVPDATPLYHDIERLKSYGIPIGWEILDNPWETGGCLGTLTFDKSFGDPRALVDAIHARGVKFMLWISPLIRLDCPKLPQYPPRSLVGSDGPAATLDFTNATADAAFQSAVRKLVELGVDGFKVDRGEEADLEGLKLAGGPGVLLHNKYPLLFAQAIAAGVKAAGASSHFVTMFHSASPGSATIASGFWGGDQPGSFRGLREAIHAGLSAGIVGDSTWGSDIGGYLPTDSAETFVRWAQFSAVSPIFEVGGQGENSTFWNYGPQTVDLFRDAAILHYELFPYLWSLIQAAHTTGVPVLRPPALEYPSRAAFWKNDDELLVGHDLLAVPVVQPAPTSISVDLPPGSWVHLATGVLKKGPATVGGVYPLSELPLYLRAGAAISFNARTPAIWSKPWPVDALQVAGRGGWLYAPAAGTTSVPGLTATVTGRRIHIVLHGAPRETQIELVGVNVRRVSAGRLAASDSALRAQTEGWERTQTPFPGVVLKLAPKNGSETVNVTLG